MYSRNCRRGDYCRGEGHTGGEIQLFPLCRWSFHRWDNAAASQTANNLTSYQSNVPCVKPCSANSILPRQATTVLEQSTTLSRRRRLVHALEYSLVLRLLQQNSLISKLSFTISKNINTHRKALTALET